MKTKHKHYAVLTATTLGLAGISFASDFGDEKYIYDASGNIVEKHLGDQVTRFDYTGNQLNGSESDSGSKRYAYDSSGLLTRDSGAGKPIQNMEHQYLDKVTKVQNGDKSTEFFYNAEGQLVATNSAGTSETFAWDGLAMVNRGDELFVNEAHAVGGVPVIIGNDVAVSDIIGSSLSVGSRSFESSAFGDGVEWGLFTGKPFVKELQSYVFKHRLYAMETNRWTTSDPVGFPDGLNNYAYAGGDPILNIDPLGTTWTVYDDQLTPASSIDTPTARKPKTATIEEEYYYTLNYSQAPTRLLSQNIPTGGNVRVTSSGSLAVSVNGGVKIYGVVDIGASATVGYDVGVNVTYPPHGSDPSKVEIWREKMTATKKYRYWGPSTPTPNPYNIGESTNGFSLAILSKSSYEN